MKKGFVPAPVLIGLAIILLITAATIFINARLIRQAKEQPVDKSSIPADVDLKE